MRPPVFRFAPSPNGYLHLGHAFSALLNFEMARAAGGTMLLRIEDIDDRRCKPEFENAIYEDLRWLGITWAEPVRRQSEHLAEYRAAIGRLDAMGLVYPAFESRSEIARLAAAREKAGEVVARDPDGGIRYPGMSKSLPDKERRRLIEAGAPYALRFDMAAAIARTGPLYWDEMGDNGSSRPRAQPDLWGDVILARRDTPNSYHLSVVIDDAAQGVTDVVRGLDLFPSTSVHRILQALFGFAPPRYHHHRLILDSDGRKLSKSTKSTSLRELRAAGAVPADIRCMLGLPKG
ncbi:MAG TPA: tRNA glutamyl-Q(34) synthetase GluQRS [Pseudorhodoplanes sp.]|nr:tRNA glutamyl-Q(34) synthetase GluQRS [Pseudorhodoplanes sp.]